MRKVVWDTETAAISADFRNLHIMAQTLRSSVLFTNGLAQVFEVAIEKDGPEAVLHRTAAGAVKADAARMHLAASAPEFGGSNLKVASAEVCFHLG